jgi:hypothetical protein
MSDYGPNVTKLIMKFVMREAIPTGGGFADGIEFFMNPERRKQVLAKAEADAVEAIRLIKSAPDNSYGDDDEVIAGVILEKIAQKMATRNNG